MKTVAIMGIAIALGAGSALAWRMATPEPEQDVASPIIDANEAAPESILPTSYDGAAIDNGAMPDSPTDTSMAAAAVGGGSETVCGQTIQLMSDGRLLNHYRYPQADAGDLVAAPAGFGGGNCSQIHRDMAGPLNDMIAAAKKDNPAVGNALMGVSCYRSVARQTELFCRADRIKSRGIVGQAKWVAPGGFSEHATGLTIDFGAKTRPECHVSTCFKDTQTGQWLAANASRFGFELSFPAGNPQGVSYEPWHYRYVGSAGAKSTFATARSAR